MRYWSRSLVSAVIRGTSERANAGRQHSSTMVSWTRSTQPLLLGRPARMKRCRAPSASTAAPKCFGAELRTVIGGDLAQLPARGSELGREAMHELHGVPRARVALGGVQLGPRVGRRDVDGGVLPDRALVPDNRPT